MNHELEEIINEIINLNISSIIRYFTVIGSALATVLTIVGLPLSRVFTKLLDFKNRKTVKYMICNKVRKCSYDLARFTFMLTFFKFIYYFFLPLSFSMFLIFILSFIGNFTFLISIQIVLISVSGFVAKRFITRETPDYKLIALYFLLFAILQTYLLSSIYGYFLYILVILGFVMVDCVILILVYAHVKNKTVLWFAIPRHIILYFVFFLSIYSDKANTILTVGVALWNILIIMEMPLHMDIASVEIHTVEGVKTTKSRIFQYECNKIMYKMEDGTIEVVDEDSILYISHITPVGFRTIKYIIIHFIKNMYMRLKRNPMKNLSIECLFRGKELKEIHTHEIINYKYTHESWIRMEVRDGDYKSDIIVNANRVKKILCRNKESLSLTSKL